MSEFVTTSRRGWGSRSKNSIGGAIFGFILVAVGTVLLFWNEGRAVKRYKDLKEGAGKVVSVSAEAVDPADEGKLIHVTGEAKTSGPLSDPDFAISEDAIKLRRDVEMYQWVEDVQTEKKENVGGSVDTKKTYSYRQEWRSELVDSSRFQVKEAHRNPTEMRFASKSFVAKGVTLGAYRLPDFLIAKIGGGEPLDPGPTSDLPPALRSEARSAAGGYYFGNDPANPQVGDLKVTFSIVRPGPLSVVAQQSGNTFVTYRAKSGGTVDLLERGILPADQMFEMAQDRNKFLTWAIRGGGFVLLGIAFSMVLGPLAVFASVLPFLGRIVETGTTVIAFLLAGIVWTITVAFAWIFYRPVLGIAILVVTVALIVLVVKKLRTGKSAASETAPPLDAPPPLV